MNYINRVNTVSDMINTVLSKQHREHTDLILEPLQAMTQIGLLRYCPIGTKIAIQHNVLVLQHPNIAQGFIRWYSGDRKDDLYNLFNVFRRFISWYGQQTTRSEQILYNTLIEQAYHGLERLINTYKSCNMGSLTHVLQMYKTFLQRPELLIEHTTHPTREKRSLSLGDIDTNEYHDHNTVVHEESCKAESSPSTTHSRLSSSPHSIRSPHIDLGEPTPAPINTNTLNTLNTNTNTLNIDMVFEQTKQLYSSHLKNIIVETFELLEQSKEDDYEPIVQGLNSMLYPITKQMESWIKDKLVF